MQLVMPRTAHCLVVRALSSLTGPQKAAHTVFTHSQTRRDSLCGNKGEILARFGLPIKGVVTGFLLATELGNQMPLKTAMNLKQNKNSQNTKSNKT